MENSISIVVAIYNRKDELEELLESLFVQTDKDFEVIIVDDGSSVDLLPIVHLFQEKLNLQYFKKSNSGPGLSRNYGAEKAKNEWLLFVDSDVVVEKDYIKNVKRSILENPADAFGGADKADETFTLLQKAISYSMTSVLTTGGIRGSKKAVSKFQPRSFNMGVNKVVFLQIGGFSEMRIGEDPDLSMTLWEKGYKTDFYDDISVYHKRRTSLYKFSKQVYQFGIARPILNKRHPQYTKITFWFPSVFLLGLIFAILSKLILGFDWFLFLYAVYFGAIFIHATYTAKSLFIGALSVITTVIQMISYGKGFLESWIQLNILKKSPKSAFPKHFY